jgi:hypothetical protein
MSYLSSNRSTLGAKDSNFLKTGESHIVLDVLYPALNNVMLDGSTALSAVTTGPNGSTVTSSKYGTVQSDGRMYYYTDIKGSKPIKDPRIGAHFGTQRHKFTSIQQLDQESAVNDFAVYSIDGRDWMRLSWGQSAANKMYNNVYGHYIQFQTGVADNTDWIEFTGYFNNVSFMGATSTNSNQYNTRLDGVDSTVTNLGVVQDSPIAALRYVSSGSVHPPTVFSSTPSLGIHTVRISNDSAGYANLMGMDLTAQDTTSTATKSQIQIPSQNVVSYGKKFTVAGTPHYSPFATKGDDSASTIPNNTTGDSVATGWAGSTSAYWEPTLDTATSLGLGSWESGGNFYRPVNGGRVVKWVDSSGAIKTSVSMMPPEADKIFSATTNTGTCDATGTHNWSTQYLPQFGNKRIGSNYVTNGSFDSNTSSWSYVTCTGASIAGGQSGNCHEVTYVSGSAYARNTSVTGLTAGKLYEFSFYFRLPSSGASPSGSVSLHDGAVYVPTWGNISDAGWTKRTTKFIASTNTLRIDCFINGAGKVLFDEFAVYEIEEPSLQSEVAKTFHVREFGNGAANLGKGAGGTAADMSMLEYTQYDNIAYVMDDGLTSLIAYWVGWYSATGLRRYQGDGREHWYITFIGTGIEIGGSPDTGVTLRKSTIVQNLPYGTHVLYWDFTTPDGNANIYIDGVFVWALPTTDHGYGIWDDVTIFQPKMPPIPEEAVVIADYMLMADYVPQTGGTSGDIAKGVRRNNNSRDVFYDTSASTLTFNQNIWHAGGFQAGVSGSQLADVFRAELPAFATRVASLGYGDRRQIYVDSGGAETQTSHGSAYDSAAQMTNAQTLGLHHFKSKNKGSTDGTISCFDISTPTHTSSHYKAFETPYLYEILGGDRNMEQTHLVVTPDGKTWDEVTRDTSYMGNVVLNGHRTAVDGSSGVNIMDLWRGDQAGSEFRPLGNKDFAIGYDRHICLRTGQYVIRTYSIANLANSETAAIYINGAARYAGHVGGTNKSQTMSYIQVYLNRGDYVQSYRQWFGQIVYSGYWIERI